MKISRINVAPKSKVLLVHITGQMEESFITHPQMIYNVLGLINPKVLND